MHSPVHRVYSTKERGAKLPVDTVGAGRRSLRPTQTEIWVAGGGANQVICGLQSVILGPAHRVSSTAAANVSDLPELEAKRFASVARQCPDAG